MEQNMASIGRGVADSGRRRRCAVMPSTNGATLLAAAAGTPSAGAGAAPAVLPPPPPPPLASAGASAEPPAAALAAVSAAAAAACAAARLLGAACSRMSASPHSNLSAHFVEGHDAERLLDCDCERHENREGGGRGRRRGVIDQLLAAADMQAPRAGVTGRPAAVWRYEPDTLEMETTGRRHFPRRPALLF